MARAVIELTGDISPLMPRMSRAIDSCAYNPENDVLGFRFEDMRVIVERDHITI